MKHKNTDTTASGAPEAPQSTQKKHGPFTYDEVMRNKIDYAKAQTKQRDTARLPIPDSKYNHRATCSVCGASTTKEFFDQHICAVKPKPKQRDTAQQVTNEHIRRQVHAYVESCKPVDYKAHAERMADAVKSMMHDLDIFYGKYRDSDNKYIAELKAALAAWEGAK